MTELHWGGATDVGRRRSNNQDSMLAIDGLFVVADGMGGHAAGEVASLTAVEALRAAFSGGSTDDLADAVVAANEAVWNRASAEPGLLGMGTTLCAVAPVEVDKEPRLGVVNVGDSRVYLMRDGELTQVTEDHSVPEQMRRAGEITDEEAAVHPLRHQLTRVLGQGPHIEPDAWDLVPFKGDRLLLCSDGLTNEVSDKDIAALLRQHRDPDEAARALVRVANENGGLDNITVVVVDVTEDDDRAARASLALASDAPPSPRPSGLMTREQREAELRAIADATDTAAGPDTWGEAPADFELPARRFTWRAAVFLLVLLMVLGATAGAIGWYARASYFVGLHSGDVTIFKGRPGGFLWFNPTVEERTDIPASDIPPARLDIIEAGKLEPSLGAARRYVENLGEDIEARTPPTTTADATTATTAGAPPS